MPNESPDPPSQEEEAASPPSAGSTDGDDAGPELDRLPPPAFPPGSRHSSVSWSRIAVGEGSETNGDTDIPEDAFISPDEPIRSEGRGIPDDAFISPDDPFVPSEGKEEGKVTGLGGERPEPSSSSTRAPDRPTIHELPYLLDQLAERLHRSGEKALNVRADTGHFQAALRSFLKGYLEGSRD